MKNNRMETLKNNGIDTSKYFTLLVNEDIPAGTKINISLDTGENSVASQIEEDGYVKNTRLHRRWVAAQYMRMLESKEGWHGYLRKYYTYMYQFDMMFEEVRVLSILERKDKEVFAERCRFFTLDVVRKVLDNYLEDVRNYVDSLKVKRCKGEPYKYIKGIGNVFEKNIYTDVIAPIEASIKMCKRNYNYADMYYGLMILKKFMVVLPHETKKSKIWVDTFQKEGAFYTLKNLIMFHDVHLYIASCSHSGNFYSGIRVLNELVNKYEGYQMNALLKETIKANNFDFKKSIEAHK